jgi:hypothetical protein
MARYFFDLRGDYHSIEDEEGPELETAAEARAQAIKSLREILAAAIKSGAPAILVDAVVIVDEMAGSRASYPSRRFCRTR